MARLSYLDAPSDRLVTILKCYNYRVGFYPMQTIRHLSRLKDNLQQLDKARIYKISCGECPAVYVSQTGRKLRSRFSEHRSALNPNRVDPSLLSLTTAENRNMISPNLPSHYYTPALREGQ